MFRRERREGSIRRESELDGVYVVRTSEPKRRCSAEDAVRRYKSLAQVERAFRTLKGLDLRIRSIHLRTEDHVRAHILCMLAFYVEWQMRKDLAPLLFDDEQLDQDRQHRDPVLPAECSASAKAKKLERVTADGFPVHSFSTLLNELATRCRNICRIPSAPNSAAFPQVTEATPLQRALFSFSDCSQKAEPLRAAFPNQISRMPLAGCWNFGLEASMKITPVKTVVVNAEMRNWVFVKVETSEPGLYGWGECSLEWKTRSVVGAVEDFAPMVVGEDPTRIEHLYQKMYRQSFWRTGVIGLSAISGIEQACWDILGKSLNRPVYQLLGGAVRDRVRMYTHLGGGDMRAVYETQRSVDPSVFVDRALEVVAKGYTALKVLITPPTEAFNSIAAYKDAARMMETLRLAVGDGVDIMVDCHGRHSLANALEFCRILAPYRPYFIEEPVPPENVDLLAEVRKASPVPIATGERLVTRHEFRRIFEMCACHVIQPDLCHCGGLWEAKKIAAMTEVYSVGVAPHNPLGPVANAAALHFDLSTPNFLIQEDMLADVPWRWEVVRHSLKTEKGCWLPTDAPGLGIEVDETAATRHPFQREVLHSLTGRAHDNAILDW